MTAIPNEDEIVGILAYGSLISDPGDKIIENRIDTIYNVNSRIPVEFARRSKKRGYAATLVPFKEGKTVEGQVFVMNLGTKKAADLLFTRETVGPNKPICSYPCDRGIFPIDVTKIKWKAECKKNNEVHIVKLPYEWPETILVTWIDDNMKFVEVNKNKAFYSERLAINAIISVSGADRYDDGITYLNDAIGNGIDTVLSQAYKDTILKLTKSKSLCQALDKSFELREDLKELSNDLKKAEKKELNEGDRFKKLTGVKEKLVSIFNYG